MIVWIACTAGVIAAYLLGSIPTGYLAGRLLRGIDTRNHGSQSTGATNVLRTLGKGPALAVLLVVAGGLYVIALHRANIARLLAGTEPKVGRSSP